jgi:tRNA-specific 2-thiouridylase
MSTVKADSRKEIVAAPKVFVAMSGGVDSSVAAALLKERGFDVRGIHIKIWSDPDIPCAFKEDRLDAMRAAAKIGIPFETWDFTREYKSSVVERMIREYALLRTPNPDVLCNREIKFGIFLAKAIAAGADYVATGHYVSLRETRNQKSKIYELLQAKDRHKDQSYFLWSLVQDQLARCIFPLGEYTKPRVREMARTLGLSNAGKPDSQGICFIGEINLRDFLKKHIPVFSGEVVTTAGRVVGEHEGLPFYTIGQRQGIGIGGGIPYYVAEKNSATNTLVVAAGPYDEKLFSRELVARDANWISGKEPELPLRCQARIRYRQPLHDCTLTRIRGARGAVHAAFEEPQRAVTPGQSIVFYNEEKVLGGAVIER